MNNEKKSAHNIWIGDSDISYAQSLSPHGSTSEGIRFALRYHRVTEANIDKMVEALETTPIKEEG